jgi:hypothetical protein
MSSAKKRYLVRLVQYRSSLPQGGRERPIITSLSEDLRDLGSRVSDAPAAVMTNGERPRSCALRPSLNDILISGASLTAAYTATGKIWVVVVIPFGVILVGAALGISSAISQGLRFHILRLMKVEESLDGDGSLGPHPTTPPAG